ncbi:MAG: hypothetical protein CL878_14975 [Dehalococcoidia bacterium]|nr:hypothetical protein [Dehalococcoidia bacterium]
MKITSLELLPAYSTREMGRTGPADPEPAVSNHVIVRLRTDAGIIGLGEMSDVPWKLTRETLLRLQARLDPLLLDSSPFDLTAIQMALGRQEWEHQVICGVDIALHDALAKALDIPLFQLFGGKFRDRIPCCYPLARCRSAADIAANLERVQHLLDQGHAAIRYYFGADLEMDERFLAELRQRWGSAIEINALDASGLFEVDAAIEAIQRLAPFRPNLVESPVRGRHNAPTEDFIAVRRAVDVPIGEHVPSLAVAARLARHQAVDVFNLGIGYDGLSPCRKAFGIAEAFGIRTLLGSTVELSIGTAARAHLVAAMPNLSFRCYPAGPLVYREQVVKDPVRYEAGQIVVPDGPGLGVELDEERLAAQRLW